MGCDVKVSRTTLGTSQQQNLGIEAREPGVVLGPSPDGAARRASARACCHRVEACPDGSRGTPPGPHWDPVLPREPLAPGCRPKWAQMALAEELAGLPHPGRPQSRSQELEGDGWVV